MSKRGLIHALVKPSQANEKQRYISYLNKDTNNDIHKEINKIRMQLFEFLFTVYEQKSTKRHLKKTISYRTPKNRKIEQKKIIWFIYLNQKKLRIFHILIT